MPGSSAVAQQGLERQADRSHRPRAFPRHASSGAEAHLCELRRAHRKFEARRILHELMLDTQLP
jgi:hypothetical protein